MFIHDKQTRDTVRTKLKFGTKKYLDFVYDYMGTKRLKIKYYVGKGCKNLIIVVNKKTCFKFPLYNSNINIVDREKKITDYFSGVLQKKIPNIEIIKYGEIYVEKYDFIDGITVNCANLELVKRNILKIADQLADFLFIMTKHSPDKLKSFVPINSGSPGFLYGWGHMDIGGNFILNPKTMDVIGFIDWENAGYGDIMPDLVWATQYWCKLGLYQLGIEIVKKYAEKYLEYVNSGSKAAI